MPTYAKLSDLKAGDTVTLDGGFTCHRAGKVVIKEVAGRLYFNCEEGMHFLDGQADDGVYCIGVSV